MKKALSVFLSFLMLFSVFIPVSVSASDDLSSIADSSVEDDLSSLYKDLETKFPKVSSDEKIYLVHFVENGYNEVLGMETEYFGLYLYVYNPSGQVLIDELNKVQFAVQWSKDSKGNFTASDWAKYDLEFVDANDDNTLIKYRVKDPDTRLCWCPVSSRRYDISGIELAHTTYDIENYTVGYSFTFNGYAKGMSSTTVDKSTLTCIQNNLLTITVDAHQVSYLTGNSNLGGGYSNQVNSVYFSIPSDIEEKYGDLYQIKYEYNHYYTSPIIVTDNEASYNTLMADRGKLVDSSWKYSLKKYNANSYDDGAFSITHHYYDFLYGDLKKENNVLNYYYYDRYLPYSTTVFYDSDSWSRGDVLFTAEEFEEYFQSYNKNYYTGKVLGYSADLFDLNNSSGYQVFTKNINDEFTLKGYNDSYNRLQKWADWGFRWNYDEFDNINNIKYIERINSTNIFTSDSFETTYLIDDCYKEELKSFYEQASLNDESVYLLRYAYANDYYSLDLTANGIDGNFIMCQGNVYLNFNLLHFGFGNSKNLTIIPVVSDPSNGFFVGTDTTTERNSFSSFLNEIADKLSNIMKISGIVLLILAIVALVVVCFVFIKPLNDWVIAIFSKEKRSKPKPPSRTRAKSKRSYSGKKYMRRRKR